jgi:hypothetical protein
LKWSGALSSLEASKPASERDGASAALDGTTEGRLEVDRETGEVVGSPPIGESGNRAQPRGDARLEESYDDGHLHRQEHELPDMVDGSGERIEVRSSAAGSAELGVDAEPSALANALVESSLNAAGVFLAEPLSHAMHIAEAFGSTKPGPEEIVSVSPRQIPKTQSILDVGSRAQTIGQLTGSSKAHAAVSGAQASMPTPGQSLKH